MATANHPANTLCPAIAELKVALESIPDLYGIELGTIRQDGSRHTAGLAMDIMLDSRVPSTARKAERLIAALVEAHPKMGWYDLIHTDFHIPGHPLYRGKHLTRNPVSKAIADAHLDHIHIDWCDYNLRVQPLEQSLVYDWPDRARSSDFGYYVMAGYATN
jgi:hypothetical protein